MSEKNDGNQNPQNAKVLKLGLNISVSGDPGTDFEIVLDKNNQKAIESSSQYEEQLQSSDALELESSTTDTSKHELEKANIKEVIQPQSRGAIPKHSKTLNSSDSSDSLKKSELKKQKNFASKDISIINKIKSTMEHFEKFSDHIKEIPRLRNCPIATSTPFSDKYNSKSESNLMYPQYRVKNYSYVNDFSRKDYFKSSVKPPDLFLKPLPAEGYYKRGIYSRFFDLEPYKHYGSDSNLNKTENKVICSKTNYDFEKCEGYSVPIDPPSGILKKSDSESGDRQSTSSADSIKDIKIYQTGGILIMQNFKDSMDVNEKREISEFSAKLIENCNKLRLEMNNLQEHKPAINNFLDENKNSGKIVQFDLSSFESQKSKSGDSPSNALKDESSSRLESSDSTSDCMKNKDTSPQGTSQSQDFPSLSTQENDSILSNPPGMSPSYASSKKLEWDSGADVGYLNLDLTKENLSTIEKIVLKGLSSDGLSEKNVVYEKTTEPDRTNRSKFIMERKPSDSVIENMAVAMESKNEMNTINNNKKNFIQDENEKSESEVQKKENSVRIYSNEIEKDNKQPGKFDEIKPASPENSSKVISIVKTNETYLQVKALELEDKSVNVNTLFDDHSCQTPVSISKDYLNPFECHVPKLKKSPKLKISKSKRLLSQRLLKASKKIIPKHSTDTFEMSIPNQVFKKVEATPAINDFELSKEVEEIIIDQRFQITQNVAADKEVTLEPEIITKDKIDSIKDSKSKSRPISASSSSNNTVLPKFENKEYVDDKRNKTLVHSEVTDQIVQTSDYDFKSIGVQAFASQVSSDGDFKSVKKSKTSQSVTKEFRENVNMSSKNIQAFGLNCSLPKQLEHPKETALFDSQQTKSTQFFGGPLNSLPNYHSNLVIKPGESCGRTLNVLKTKKNSEAEMIRLREENEKNILANDAPKLSESKVDLKKRHSNRNKENLISHISKNDASQDSEKKESEHVKAKKKSSFDGSDCPHTSDEVSSRVLTYEVLKVHGESIDRNIIQEKYFQSQLVEMDKRKMVSRSTSMELQLQLQPDETVKEYMTTGCQYSPQSKATTSEEHYQEPEGDSFKEDSSKRNRRRASQYRCRQNKVEEQCKMPKTQELNLGAGDSLPSSTQTAHSWISGAQNSPENTSGVGRARSFEYLPGHIYESSGNLREKLPSETERNLISSSSSDSDTAAKVSVSGDEARNSEGRSTLILENSTPNSHESDRLKILDKTLAQLNVVVMKLSEKDAQVQSVTQSLLANLWKKSGSGDSLTLGQGDASKTEMRDKNSVSKTLNEKQKKETFLEVEAESFEPKIKEGIACQTEDKSSSESEKYFEEKKALKKRISEEKQSQIEWIENEIQHLNILRKILEKQNSPVHNNKKLSPHTIGSIDDAKSKESYQKNIVEEIFPRTVTPVYGCTISLSENPSSEKNHPGEEKDCRPTEKEPCSPQYRMAVSLTSDCSKNWKHIVMVPVGLQVSLNNSNFLKYSLEDETNKEKNLSSQDQKSPNSDESNMIDQHKPTQSDVITQFPSIGNIFENNPSACVQTNFPSTEGLNHYAKESCFRLNLSDKSSLSVSHSSKSKSEKRDSTKLRLSNEESGAMTENKTSHTTDTEHAQMESSSVSEPVKKTTKTLRNESSDLTGSSDKCVSKIICTDHSTNSKCQKAREKSESRRASTQSMNCKCQHCSERVSLSVSKQGIICRGPCQSNIYLSSEKSSDDPRTCLCSKIQVQKSLHGTCHVIKIHGSKCCSNEKSSCSCEKQSLAKQTEDQFCQTDSDHAKPTLEIKHTEAEPILERKTSVVEKLSCDPKVGYEKMHPSAVELDLKEKSVVNKRLQEVGMTEKMKALLNCNCQRKAEKGKADDHPRHYFLKIEEKVVDDSSEPREQKKSLEVITVTVPVKKAGRSKIYGGNMQQTRYNEKPKSFVDVSSVKCKCCSKCTENCSSASANYQKASAEKSELSTWDSGLLKPLESTSCEDLSVYPSKELPQRFSSSQEYYQDKSGLNQTGSSYERVVDDGYEFRCCESCNCINRNITSSREFQNEYDSHKSRTSSNAIGNSRNYEDKKHEKLEHRARFDLDRRVDDWSYEPRRFRSEKPNEKADWCDPDYYNYNKKEFMTKSELLKEEKQKRKAQQPSLQECLSSNRPDFYSSAEKRREIINKRAEDRAQRHNNRMECLLKMMQKCKEESLSAEPKRMFTTQEMREQTLKRYKKLPEVTGKIADQKKKEEYRTNKLMADVFAKKLQIEALKVLSGLHETENNTLTTGDINWALRIVH